MSLKVKSNGINFNVPTIEDLPTERLEEDLVCVVTDENRGGVFVYQEANALVNNGGTIFNGWTRQYDGAVNVKWFGAKGDGITDDTVAIQATVDAGGNIFIPSGNYPVSTTLILASDFTIFGEGKGETVIQLANSVYLFIKSNYSKIENLQFHKITPTSNYITIGSVTEYPEIAPRFTWIDNCKFDADSFPTFTNYAVIGNYKSFDLKVTNCLIETFHLGVLTKYFESQRVTIENNVFSMLLDTGVTNSELCKIEAVYEGYINNNTFYGNNTGNLSCITLESGSNNVIVSNNKIISNGYGIRIDNVDSPSFPSKTCIIENNIITANISTAKCIYSGASVVEEFNINNNTINGGCLIYGSKISVDSNYFYGYLDTTNTGLAIIGDVYFVKNNTFFGYKYAIQTDSTSTGNQTDINLVGNIFRGQSDISMWVKYQNGKGIVSQNAIVNTSSGAFGTIYISGGGEADSQDTIFISNNSIISPSQPAIKISYANGITCANNSITAVTPYAINNSDTFNKDQYIANSTVFNSASSRINTQGKYEGLSVFDYALNKPLWATGALATSTWVDAAGTTVYTPA